MSVLCYDAERQDFTLHTVLAMEQGWILVDLLRRWLISDFALGDARICHLYSCSAVWELELLFNT